MGVSSLRRIAMLAFGIGIVMAGATAFSWRDVKAPAIGVQADGTVLVPTNQTLTPVGIVNKLEDARPKDLALSPDGKTVAVLCTSQIAFFEATGALIESVKFDAAPEGIAWLPDGSAVYASGKKGKVARLESVAGHWKVIAEALVEERETSLRKPGQKTNPQPTGLAVTPDGKNLIVALGIRNAVAILSVPEHKVLTTFPVSPCPYSLTLSKNGKTLVVVCKATAAPDDANSQKSAGTSVRVREETDSAARGSVSIYELNPDRQSAWGFRKTLSSVIRAIQPSHAAFSPDGKQIVFTNSGNDSISVLLTDQLGRGEVKKLRFAPPGNQSWGFIPNASAFSSDGKTLYVTCGGANAVAVIQLDPKPVVLGLIPTAWYPIAIAETNGTLAVACSKGIGARPIKHDRGFNVHMGVGVVQFITADAQKNLRDMTRQVSRNNHWDDEKPARERIAPRPVPERVGEPSLFKHVVYIIKENHTYDEDLGDMPEGNGDPKMCLFGEQITPNAHALAREFVLLDNTYTSGTNSADGHQWVASSAANDYMEHNYDAHERSYPYDGGDPIAYSPRGFLWNAAKKAGVTQRIYGEFVNRPVITDTKAGSKEGEGIRGGEGGAVAGRSQITWKALWDDYKSGGKRFKIEAGTDQAALRPFIHPTFIGFPSTVSDQWRADVFLEDLKKFETAGEMPRFMMMLLPDDHTSGTRAGMPTPRAAVADNDLALGRIVEAISRSQFWKDTLILVVEDDSQMAFDHVDGHRTVAQAISPYTKRHSKVSIPYNHTSFARTIGLVLGMPAMNHFDRAAVPLSACFTNKADLTPYVSRPNRVALDELNPAPRTQRGLARRLAEASAKLDLSDVDRADPNILARAVWENRRPGVKYPLKGKIALDDDD